MAGIEYIDLQGNEVILKAVEYLRMLPEWKAKPGKLRTGHVEYCELIARHLINLYCHLEGKPLTEKIELNETINPLAQERDERAAQRNEEATLKGFSEVLNKWHLELAIVDTGIDHVVSSIDGDEAMGAIGYVLKNRLHHLVESCPFPHPVHGHVPAMSGAVTQ